MAGTRTQIKAALFTLLQGAEFPFEVNGSTVWVTTGRRLKLWNEVDPSKQPAMYLVQHKEEYQHRVIGSPGVRYLNMAAWCYAPTGDESVVGDDYLDWMLAGIEGTLLPDEPQSNKLTLGNLCYSVEIDRMNSMFIRDPGDNDGQALLVVPIRICIP